MEVGLIIEDELIVTTAESFQDWLLDPLTKRGDRVAYHIGHLAADKGLGTDEHKARVRGVARAALAAAGYAEGRDENGRLIFRWNRRHRQVRLFQRRVPGGSAFEYLAIRA